MTDLVPIGQLPGLPAPPSMNALTPAAGRSAAAPVRLSRQAKAAVVVRLLLNEGADIPLEELPDDLQEELTHQMGALRLIDRDTLAEVIEEFSSELERIGLSFSGGIAGALDALEGKINRHTAARLRKEAGVRQSGDPWKNLSQLEADKLLPVLEGESIEVAAVVLSKLKVATAAEILGKLPGPVARRITYAVSMTSGIDPETVDRIGLALASQFDNTPAQAFDATPVERVGAILNSTTSLTRDDVLEGLDESDKGFANAVRKAIFTFANIPQRIAPRDLPRILREVVPEDLLVAMTGAETAGYAATRDFILENMSGRMADQLREEMEEKDTPKPAEVEEAMSNVITVIRGMEQSGDLLFVNTDEED